MNVILSIVAIVLALLGVIGCILPILPGVLISFAGLVVLFFCPGCSIGFGTIVIYGVIATLLTIVDFILPSYFSKKFGGSKAGRNGATIGMIVGLFAGLFGIIVFPCIGAILGELIHNSKNKSKAVKVGFGTFLSFFVGTGMKMAYSLVVGYKIASTVWYMLQPTFNTLGEWFAAI